MRPVFNIAPRVVVYPHGTPPPPVEEGWLLLAQFESWPPAALDSPPPAEFSAAVDTECSMPPPAEFSAAVDTECSMPMPAEFSAVDTECSMPLPAEFSAVVDTECSMPPPAEFSAAVDTECSMPLPAEFSAAVDTECSMPPPAEFSGAHEARRPVEASLRHVVFGDGSHATTRLCAGAVDLLCRQRRGMAVLDVGTGTGILARIARARGASFVVGTDIDPTAVACAKAHAELDEVGSPHGMATDAAGAGGAAVASVRATAIGSEALRADTHFSRGAPVANIHFGTEAPDYWGARFDLVVANILEEPLHALAPALCRALLPGGVLLISGFTRPQAPALRLAYETAGLQSAGDFTLDGWVLLKFTAP